MCHDRHLVNYCVRYLQKIDFSTVTVIKLLFLDVVEVGNENENVI